MKKIFLIFVLLAIMIFPGFALARENVNYWYVKDFKTDITLNNDSSLDIVEMITADCGVAQKHGIFRVLPTVQYLENSSLKSPVKLKGITDFNGKPYHYTSSTNFTDRSVTWKIGEENVLVSGVNQYKISYSVKNALRHSEDLDELYWNLSGNFWDIPIDNFVATIHLPSEINQDNIDINMYSGSFGEDNPFGVDYDFIDKNTLKISYAKTMEPGEGITISAAFPAGLVKPYVPGFFEKYGAYFFYLIPVIILYFSFLLWRKYGRDPKVNPTVAPEFEIPENLSPIEMGLVYSDGSFKNHYISASIVNLAVKGYLKIKQSRKKPS